MEFGPEAPRPSSDEARRARLQQLAYGDESSPAQRAQALAALDAIEQEERDLIRARAAGTSVDAVAAVDTRYTADTVDEWELREAPDTFDDHSPFDRRRTLVKTIALVTAVAVGLTAVGAGLAFFF